jgi:hypothetical protein
MIGASRVVSCKNVKFDQVALVMRADDWDQLSVLENRPSVTEDSIERGDQISLNSVSPSESNAFTNYVSVCINNAPAGNKRSMPLPSTRLTRIVDRKLVTVKGVLEKWRSSYS